MIADASIPKLFAFVLINPETYPADDSIGTVIFTESVLLESTVSVYAAVTWLEGTIDAALCALTAAPLAP